MLFRPSDALRAAEKYVLKGRIHDAIRTYRAAVAGDPANLSLLNTLGDLCLRAGQNQDAQGYFIKIAEMYNEQEFWSRAIAMYKKVIRLDPLNPGPKIKLADLYLRTRSVGKAREAYLQAADDWARLGRAGQAREAVERVLSFDPANARAHRKMGEVCRREGALRRALQSYLTAASFYLEGGEVDEALEACAQAATIDPQSLQALETRAKIYARSGQPERAFALLDAALEEKPADAGLLIIRARTCLAAGMIPEAEQVFLDVAVTDPSRAPHLLEVWEVFLEAGDLDRAAALTDRCLDVLIAAGGGDRAVDFLRRVLDRDRHHLVSLQGMVRLYSRLNDNGNLARTLSSLVDAALQNGDQTVAVEALRELVRLEPGEPSHRQRLYTLGVADAGQGLPPEWILMTGTLDSRPDHDQASHELPALWSPYEVDQHAGKVEDGGASASVCEAADYAARLLREELGAIDYYLAQRHNEIAQSSLEQLRQDFGDLPEILARYRGLEENVRRQTAVRPAAAVPGLCRPAEGGETSRATAALKNRLVEDPDNVWLRTALKHLYLRAGEIGLATTESIQLARIQETQLTADRSGSQGVTEVSLYLPGEPCRRKLERVPVKVPALVAAADRGWSEFTEVLNLSRFGALVRLSRAVESGTLLQLKLVAPFDLLGQNERSRVYAGSGLIAHVSRAARGDSLVGIEFGIMDKI